MNHERRSETLWHAIQPIEEEAIIELSDHDSGVQPSDNQDSAQKIDALATWKSVDGKANDAYANLSRIWADPASRTYVILRQSRFPFYVLLSLVPTFGAIWLAEYTTTQIDASFLSIVLPIAFGIAAFGIEWLIEQGLAEPRTTNALSDACETIQKTLSYVIITDGGKCINVELNHISQGLKNSGRNVVGCLETVFLIWRKMMLLPYLIDKDWNFFKFANIVRHDKRVVSSVFHAILLVSALVLTLFLVKIESPVSQSALISGWVVFATFLFRIRRFFRIRMTRFLKEISAGLREYETPNGSQTWASVIAEYDPLPVVAEKFKVALDNLHKSPFGAIGTTTSHAEGPTALFG